MARMDAIKARLVRARAALLLVAFFAAALVLAPALVRRERERRDAVVQVERADRWVLGPAPAPERIVWLAQPPPATGE